jgi:uncharacterized Zn-binding protein involved in type VI secretion
VYLLGPNDHDIRVQFGRRGKLHGRLGDNPQVAGICKAQLNRQLDGHFLVRIGRPRARDQRPVQQFIRRSSSGIRSNSVTVNGRPAAGHASAMLIKAILPPIGNER